MDTLFVTFQVVQGCTRPKDSQLVYTLRAMYWRRHFAVVVAGMVRWTPVSACSLHRRKPMSVCQKRSMLTEVRPKQLERRVVKGTPVSQQQSVVEIAWPCFRCTHSLKAFRHQRMSCIVFETVFLSLQLLCYVLVIYNLPFQKFERSSFEPLCDGFQGSQLWCSKFWRDWE